MDRLKQNIKDMVAEQQIKIGYLNEKLRFYYPLASLNKLLCREDSKEEMSAYLVTAFQKEKSEFAGVEVYNEEERFCFVLPREVGQWVHEHISEYSFLEEFIDVMGNHPKDMEEILRVFYRHSGDVQVEETPGEEFDMLVHFPHGKPDEYMYCLKKEGHHITYHRFTKDDYGSIVQ